MPAFITKIRLSTGAPRKIFIIQKATAFNVFGFKF